METKFKRGDRVLVKDEGDIGWLERTFVTTIENSLSPYICVTEGSEERFNNGRKFLFETWDKIKQLKN